MKNEHQILDKLKHIKENIIDLTSKNISFFNDLKYNCSILIF